MEKYTGFTYKGIHSFKTESFKAYILNDGEELKFSNSPSLSPEFAFPKFGDVSYYLGTTKENRELTFRVMVVDATMAQYRSFIKWITGNTEDQQRLQFDYEPFFGYNVKLTAISDGVFFARKECNGETSYNVEVELTFQTVGESSALALEEEIVLSELVVDVPKTQAGGAFKITNTSSEVYNIKNNTNMDLYLKFIQNTASTVQISEIGEVDDIVIYKVEPLGTPTDFTIYSKYDVAIDNTTNRFIEMSKHRIFKIESNTQVDLRLTNVTKIIPIIREIV